MWKLYHSFMEKSSHFCKFYKNGQVYPDVSIFPRSFSLNVHGCRHPRPRSGYGAYRSSHRGPMAIIQEESEA